MKIDKKQIEAYSKEISKICKLYMYDPSEYCFEDYFEDASDFYFVPYIKELAESCEDDECEEFLEKIGSAIDEVYDSTIELTLDEIKDFIKGHISLKQYISNGIENRVIEPELVLEWFIKNCDDKIIQKFINWVLE